MPERHDMPDRVDEAYRRAEQALDDEAARAARRASVLAAVSRAPAAPVSPPRPRSILRRYGGWLAAAGVAGLSVLTAEQVHRLSPGQPQVAPPAAPPPAPAKAPPAAPTAASPAAPPAPSAAPSDRRSRFTRSERPEVPPPALPRPPLAPPADVAPPPPLPIPPVEKPLRALPPPPSAFAEPQPNAAKPEAAGKTPEDAAVAAQPRRAFAAQAAPAAQAPETAGRLRDAAAAGRLQEIETLLAEGVPVDAPDENGETALMRSVEAGRPDAAALLRRHGASLELKTRAGVSARDLAARKNDPALDQALGISPSAAARP